MSNDITAKILRESFEEELKMLQELCKHENSTVMPYQWAPGHLMGEVRVCDCCEKILKDDEHNEPILPKKSWAFENPEHDNQWRVDDGETREG